MKLQQILSGLNLLEKTKFINCLDKLCFAKETDDIALSKVVENLNGKMKYASGSEIDEIFHAVSKQFKAYVKEQLSLSEASVKLLVNIITRDGNAVARRSWIEKLYTDECKSLDTLLSDIQKEIKESGNCDFDRPHRLSIFNNCLEVAYKNDLKIKRQENISDDERSVLNQLAKDLKITNDEFSAIEHMYDPIKADKSTIEDSLNTLRDMGLIFIKKKDEVFIADEIIRIINKINKKEVSDKYFLRILRTLSDAELSSILKTHGKRIRGVSRIEKIKTIIHSGISIREILQNEIFDETESLNNRKDRIKTMMSDLNIETDKLGTTLEERVSILIDSLNSATEREFNAISATSYKDMYSTLEVNFNKITGGENKESFAARIKREFELEPAEEISTERLRALSITPHDILYLLSNDEIKVLRDAMDLPKRGDPRLNILNAFANANDKLIEEYIALSRRDLPALRQASIDINEADIGAKFEEVTKTIFEEMGLDVEEDIRKAVNTSKDKADIIISISDDDIIVGEAKTCKNGDFAKYSTTSRQVKAYVRRCESQGKRVAQTLIIAPSFSDDFIESAEMDTEINISLLTAEGLKKIYDAYRSKRRPNFSAKLLTKGGLLKAELIAKNI